ncbi:hypothetical protein BU16DRAFT_539371 [Lophium mytilinum]|uniref:Uncharacterized protein n=1 Tax=Lophium mytilinum TaxID=390894 RepID=A0A6A6QSM4_9PEZI|nr:hypothetical protein BU16DRAFT_539371 [Lophium mytilinum]
MQQDSSDAAVKDLGMTSKFSSKVVECEDGAFFVVCEDIRLFRQRFWPGPSVVQVKLYGRSLVWTRRTRRDSVEDGLLRKSDDAEWPETMAWSTPSVAVSQICDGDCIAWIPALSQCLILSKTSLVGFWSERLKKTAKSRHGFSAYVLLYLQSFSTKPY